MEFLDLACEAQAIKTLRLTKPKKKLTFLSPSVADTCTIETPKACVSRMVAA